jgi:predicted HD superfamily hydrolase involved in NAD metabolism
MKGQIIKEVKPFTKEQAEFFSRFQKNFVTITYQGKAVSSTHIRVLLACDESTDGMIDGEVETYLKSTGAYRVDGTKEALALEKPSRKAHTIRVALKSAQKARSLGVDERKAITASLLHDCAKDIQADDPLLSGFEMDESVPAPVLHQYTGAYLAKNHFGVDDEEVLDAIRYHTSGRAGMTPIEKLVYLADALEEGRTYAGVDALRKLWDEKGVDECLEATLKGTLEKVKRGGETPYYLTEEAYQYYKKEREKYYGRDHE